MGRREALFSAEFLSRIFLLAHVSASSAAFLAASRSPVSPPTVVVRRSRARASSALRRMSRSSSMRSRGIASSTASRSLWAASSASYRRLLSGKRHSPTIHPSKTQGQPIFFHVAYSILLIRTFRSGRDIRGNDETRFLLERLGTESASPRDPSRNGVKNLLRACFRITNHRK